MGRRSEGSSRFKILKWLPDYLKWYFYGRNNMAKKNFINEKNKSFLVTGGTDSLAQVLQDF